MEEQVIFNGWKIYVDKKETKSAYEIIHNNGGSNFCDCSACKNFKAVCEKAFPKVVLELFNLLGIDYRYYEEVYHVYTIKQGLHSYAGWFHFIGRFEGSDIMEQSGMGYKEIVPGFEIGLTKNISLLDPAFKGKDIVQLEFTSDIIPWVIDEEEPLW